MGLMRELNSDEAVMRHLTGRPSTVQETHAEWEQRRGQRSDPERGLGYWAGWADGDFVGWWGLGACSWDSTTANLGYRLAAAHWGRGLATEGGLALVRQAFDVLGLASVWAATRPSNLASQHVLRKLSMRYTGVRYDHRQYEVTAGEWAQADA